MHKQKILVIDDDLSITHAIRRELTLQSDSYEIMTSKNGWDGLELYYSQNPILILLDLKMPVMDGLEFLQSINLSASDICSVIMLTGHDDDESISRSFSMGASAYLRKPFNACELGGLVRNSIALKLMQHRLVKEIELKEQAQHELSEERDRFLSILMHNLKNPMFPIVSYINKIIDGRLKSEEERRNKLHIIRESSEEIMRVIEETSVALRDKRTVDIFDPTTVSLRDLLVFTLRALSVSNDEHSLTVTLNGQDEKNWDAIHDITLEADHRQIKTLFENLISNALKYARSRIEIELYKRQDSVTFSISDDGQGIPDEYKDRIFQEYYQVPGSKQGTGLGLYSVRRVVDNHSGTITVSCPLSGGIRFDICLPLYP